ncbi:hypothetical protein MNBD_GAMMA01-396 [hydrothermal vent metagenome]|uniref:Decaprenyl-phosphate phosphoribosyltransferase n=1 Tax=hydrothermal vent metagenome TaxID=652676 RepID=A0A3B0WBW9_9ZZZZ
MASGLYDFLKLMRLHQLIKNLFIFMPLFFVGSFFDIKLLAYAFFAFVAFSLVTSSVYIFNDLQDIADDRLHPKKKYRPLAAGLISTKNGIIGMLLLFIAAVVFMGLTSVLALQFMLAYVGMNIAYSLYLKRIAIVDICIIAVGFVLRLYVGSSATNIPLSKWIVAMTFLLALFIALAKRRDDVMIYLQTGKQMRASTGGYNLKFLDWTLVIIAVVTVVVYFLYTVSPEVTGRLQVNYLYFSTVFVIIGLVRYLKITLIDQNSGAPVAIVLADKFMQLTIIAWLGFFTWVLYDPLIPGLG